MDSSLEFNFLTQILFSSQNKNKLCFLIDFFPLVCYQNVSLYAVLTSTFTERLILFLHEASVFMVPVCSLFPHYTDNFIEGEKKEENVLFQ